jgi:hypothetical protein
MGEPEPDNDGPNTTPSCTVAGVTFTAEQVKSVVLNIDGREVSIGEQEQQSRIGFER